MAKSFRTSAVAAAASTAVLLAACGGGENTSKNATDTVASSERAALRDMAKQAGIGKTVFTLSSETGALGTFLRQDGWTFQPSQVRDIPNESTSVVYVNADTHAGLAEELNGFANSFKGVFVIDSSKLFEPKSERVVMASSPQNQNSAESAPTATDKVQATAVTDFYYALSGKKAKGAPVGTALVTSATSGNLFPITFDTSGKINGADAAEAGQVFDLQLAVATNLKIDSERKNRPEKMDRKAFADPVGSWDRVIDISQLESGWHAVGRAYIEAYGEKAASRRFIAAEITTGNNQDACYVNGLKCGIYPSLKGAIIVSSNVTATSVTATSFAVRYLADVRVDPALQVMHFRPAASSWTASEAVDSDSYEVVWSEGFAVGGSIGYSTAGSWSLTSSGTYSKATVHRKRMHSWSGVGEIFDISGSATAKGAKSGVDMLDDKRISRTGWTTSVTSHPGESIFEEQARQLLLKKNWDCGGGSINMGRDKPKMSFEGWQPSLAAQFEVPADITTGYTVTPSLVWQRAQNNYILGNAKCSSNSAFGVQSWRDNRYSHWGSDIRPASYATYRADAPIVIYPYAFTN